MPEMPDSTLSPNGPARAGWTVAHMKYGKWFISREAVIANWKQYRAQAYSDEPACEPSDETVETWFHEQISWIEVAKYGEQLERPDMAAVEAEWRRQMARDWDYPDIPE